MVAGTPSTPHGDKTAVCNKSFSRWLAFRNKTRQIAALWTSRAAARQCRRRLMVLLRCLLDKDTKCVGQNQCFGPAAVTTLPSQPPSDMCAIWI